MIRLNLHSDAYPLIFCTLIQLFQRSDQHLNKHFPRPATLAQNSNACPQGPINVNQLSFSLAQPPYAK